MNSIPCRRVKRIIQSRKSMKECGLYMQYLGSVAFCFFHLIWKTNTSNVKGMIEREIFYIVYLYTCCYEFFLFFVVLFIICLLFVCLLLNLLRFATYGVFSPFSSSLPPRSVCAFLLSPSPP